MRSPLLSNLLYGPSLYTLSFQSSNQTESNYTSLFYTQERERDREIEREGEKGREQEGDRRRVKET